MVAGWGGTAMEVYGLPSPSAVRVTCVPRRRMARYFDACRFKPLHHRVTANRELHPIPKSRHPLAPRIRHAGYLPVLRGKCLQVGAALPLSFHNPATLPTPGVTPTNNRRRIAT